MRDFSNKRGRFKVDFRFFDRLATDEGTNLFHRMVVVDMQHHFISHTVDYYAVHPDFRPLDPGEKVPEYVAQFTIDSPYPTWVEVEPGH